MDDQNPPHVALIPGPVMGQVLPFIEFAKQLVHHHGFHVTFIIPTISLNYPPPTAMVDAFQSLPPAISHVFLPPPDLQDLPSDTKPVSLGFVSIVRSLPSLRQVVQSLTKTTRLVALVTGPPATDAFDVAKEFNLSSYVLFTSGAAPLSFCFYFKKIDDMGLSLPELVQMPGCVSFHKDDLIDTVQDPNDESFRWTLYMSKRLFLAEGILVNTFIDLEPGAMKALHEDEPGKPRVYPVGPLIRSEEKSVEDKSGCLKWLDSQPPGSVVFVSFGSGGTLSQTQIDELAFGLERSGQRFIWVVRPPDNESSNAAIFSVKTQNDPFQFLPKGFMERTKGVGLVIHSWAPQSQILSHGSTGGFISHCGWNSIQESVENGVPIIAWPLYAEQKMNAVTLTEDIKIAMRPKMGENGTVVMREEIARVVKELMEGNEGKRIRERINELKVASRKVLGHGGSSFDAVSELATKWKNHPV